MSHLIDPCLRATKIAHGIRRGIDGLSPMSGLVPELRILIQEQKNVLTSLKRTAFEKEEAAKHLAIYGKTEGPDIADTLSKLALLIQKAADLERVYADSLAQSRELFKEIRVAEDDNYSIRKRKLDLEHRLSQDKTYNSSSVGKGSSSRASSINGSISGEVHPELKLLRQETMTVENELEDLKRKRIKKATTQQLDALEKLGKELIVIAYYGKRIVSGIDDTPTTAGTHADDRYAEYEGTARSAYSVKACLDTFQSWSQYAPIVQVSDIDLGDFPKDNKQAMDAMLQDLAIKSDSDWYSLQSPSSPSFPPGVKPAHNRTNSVSSSTGTMSPRTSMSSVMTTMTYVDGKPVVQVINEIPPTPELEDGPSNNGSRIDLSTASIPNSETPEPPVSPTSESAAPSRPTVLDPVSTIAETKHEVSPLLPSPLGVNGGGTHPSPFVPQSTYTPATTYQKGEAHHEHKTSSPPSGRTSRPVSGDLSSRPHLPHPLMMQRQPSYPPHHHQPAQQQQQPYPPGNGGYLPSQMPMPMPMPVPHIPELPEDGHRRHSQPISVSFPGTPPNINIVPPTVPGSSASSSSSASSPQHHRQQAPQQARNPQAIISPPELSSNSSIGGGFETDTLASHPSSASIQRRYDGPPPDYAEASMSLPAEMKDQKKKP